MKRRRKDGIRMDRKQFLTKSIKAGVCCCAVALGIGPKLGAGGRSVGEEEQDPSAQGLSADLHRRMREGSKTPDWAKVAKAESWIKSLMDNMDALLNEETKVALMNACGKSCYVRAFGVASTEKPSAETAERFLASLEKSGFKVERGSDVITVGFGWAGKQNPQGLSLKEGYCMCPLVESDVPGLSPTYCNCSAGYVQEAFERGTGRTVVSVEVLESVKRGGKDCRFKVLLVNS
jgi:hypothetical protein